MKNIKNYDSVKAMRYKYFLCCAFECTTRVDPAGLASTDVYNNIFNEVKIGVCYAIATLNL